jgi:hypothetical protein
MEGGAPLAEGWKRCGMATASKSVRIPVAQEIGPPARTGVLSMMPREIA